MDQDKKQYYFISGLPRSGSTLLCNILNQNPKFHASSTSSVLDAILMIRNNWDKFAGFKAHPNEMAKLRVMRSVLTAYYDDVDREVIFDKSRGWPGYIAMYEELFGRKAKLLITVRDIRDVIASFEKLWRETSKTSLVSQEIKNGVNFQTVEGRSEVWLKTDQPIGSSYNRIKDALVRGYGDRMHFINFEDLTSKPKETMQKVYEFIGEPYFEHDFDNVEQTTVEDDKVHGFKDLHKIKNKVWPVKSEWKEILGEFAEKYGKLNFWNKDVSHKKE